MGNNTSDYTLFMRRSIGACVSAGYGLFSNNFRNIFRETWPYAVVFAIICGILGALLESSLDHPTLPALLLLAGGIVELVFYAYGIMLFASHKRSSSIAKLDRGLFFREGNWGFLKTLNVFFRACMFYLPVAGVRSRATSSTSRKARAFFRTNAGWRTIKVTVFCLLLVISVFGLLGWGCYSVLTSSLVSTHNRFLLVCGACLLLLVTSWLLLLPLCFVSFRYIFRSHTRFFRMFNAAYIIGLRHLPRILGLVFVEILLYLVVSIIILLPFVVLSLAVWTSYHGNLTMGDPLGLPDNINIIIAVTCMFAGFLNIYIRLSLLAPMYFLYGSIETHEEERGKFKKMREAASSDSEVRRL